MYVLAADNQWINNFHNVTAMPPPPPSSLTVDLLVSHGLAAALGSQFADCSLPFEHSMGPATHSLCFPRAGQVQHTAL